MIFSHQVLNPLLLLSQVINLGNGRPFLLKDFISLVEKAVGKEVRACASFHP